MRKKGGRIVIELKHLVKRYGTHTAVDDLSLQMEPGKIYGFWDRMEPENQQQ